MVAEVDTNQGGAFFSQEASVELKALDCYYKRHMLRYGDAADFKKESAQLVADGLHRELVKSLDWLNPMFEALCNA